MSFQFDGRNKDNIQLMRARLLIQRLELLSADSIWAHKASGIRASLDKLLARIEGDDYDPDKLESLVQYGYDILNKAAEAIPIPDEFE